MDFGLVKPSSEVQLDEAMLFVFGIRVLTAYLWTMDGIHYCLS